MKIPSGKLPFLSVLAAAFVPWINGATQSNVPGYFFDLALICLAGIALTFNSKLQLRGRLLSWVFATAFCFALFMLFILHRTHFLSSLPVVAPLTLAYVIFLGNPSVNPGQLLRQLKWLYSFHIAFIVLELLLFYFDLLHVLAALSGDRHRSLYFSLLGRLTDGFGGGAPNSMLLHAQAAGHLVLSAFFLFYLTSSGKLRRSEVTVLLLLLLLFFVVVNNTSLLIFVALFATIWMIRAKLYTRVLVLFLLPLVAYLFLDEILSTIFYQVYDGTALAQSALETYLWLFTVPISNVLDAQPLQLLFGHGADTDALESGELGFATVAFNFGVYTLGVLSVWLASILIVGFMRHQRLRNVRDSISAAWNSLLFVNIILCAGWVLSAAHYLIVLTPGGVHLFAFSLAIVITANTRLSILWRIRAPEDRLDPPATPVAHASARLGLT